MLSIVADLPPPIAFSQPSIDALESELTTLAAHLNAGNYRFLQLLAEFDRRGGHVGWGIVSCAHWLQWKCGLGLVAAREKVRVARALVALPNLSDAMRRGVISYCKVRALTRIATPENEDVLLNIAEHGTVSHVEKTVRLYRKCDRAKELQEANEQHAERSVRCYYDEDGCVVIEGRLPPEQGALVMKALQAAGDALREAERDSREALDAPEPAPDRAAQPYPARQADALALLGETFLASGAAPLAAGERHLVTVHVDERVLRDEREGGRSEVDDGAALPPATVRRLCCDGSLVAIVEREDGSALDVGRKTRAVPAPMRRALDARDGGCRFPGCANARFTDAHHIEHWINGGETTISNLVLLCRRHHRFVHEYGFGVERVGGGEGAELRFLRPDGRVVPAVVMARGIEAETGCREMVAEHERRGLRIGERTGVPRWMGERMDYGESVGALQERAVKGRQARVSAIHLNHD
jgi:hypothetical protein